ncbi:hypothetical protein C0991_000831, partial [Blastosporella zonata]
VLKSFEYFLAMQSKEALPTLPGHVLMSAHATDAEALLNCSVADFLASSTPTSPSATYCDLPLNPSRPTSPKPKASTPSCSLPPSDERFPLSLTGAVQAAPRGGLPPDTTASPLVASTGSSTHNKRQSKKNRRNKRQVAKHASMLQTYGYVERRESFLSKYGDQFCNAGIRVDYDLNHGPVSRSGYVGARQSFKRFENYSLDELRQETGFPVYPWDGRTPTPVVDRKGRMLALLGGAPNDDKWPALHAEAAELLESNRCRLHLPKGSGVHWRGKFTALFCGVTHRGGTVRPVNCAQHKDNSAVLATLNSSLPFVRLSGYASCKTAPSLQRGFLESTLIT